MAVKGGSVQLTKTLNSEWTGDTWDMSNRV